MNTSLKNNFISNKIALTTSPTSNLKFFKSGFYMMSELKKEFDAN
jgi:hypothetical protein